MTFSHVNNALCIHTHTHTVNLHILKKIHLSFSIWLTLLNVMIPSCRLKVTENDLVNRGAGQGGNGFPRWRGTALEGQVLYTVIF